MVQAAIYCRVSTADQSCDRQERDLLEFAKKMGYEVTHIFKETASGARNDRKERAKVIKLAQAKKIDLILVTELTRWGRSTIDLIGTLNELQARGVSVIAQTGMNFDLTTAQGKMMCTIVAAMAEFERDCLRERIRSGVANARARGKHLGRPKGRISDKLQRKIPQIKKMSSEGYSIRSIAKHLRCSPTTVQAVLKEAK